MTSSRLKATNFSVKLAIPWLIASLVLQGCRRPPAATENPQFSSLDPSNRNQSSEVTTCPVRGMSLERAPGTKAEHETLHFWFPPESSAQADQRVLDAEQITQINLLNKSVDGGARDIWLPEVAQREHIQKELLERKRWLQSKLNNGTYVEGQPGAASEAFRRMSESNEVDEFRIASVDIPQWCIPTRRGLFTPPIDRDFDRNRCTTIHLGEPFRVLLKHPVEDWIYVDTGLSVGWIDQTSMTSKLSTEKVQRYATLQPRIAVTLDGLPVEVKSKTARLRLGSTFHRNASSKEAATIELPVDSQLVQVNLPQSSSWSHTPLAFSRRKVLEVALNHLGTPYRWGGNTDGFDCSQFTHAIFSLFGLRLPRNSLAQAQLGSRSAQVKDLPLNKKREVIRQFAERGVVLLQFPGHIMIYMGETGDGMFSISAINEFKKPCAAGDEVELVLGKVAVTRLDLGQGSSRGSLLERIDRISVFCGPLEPRT